MGHGILRILSDEPLSGLFTYSYDKTNGWIACDGNVAADKVNAVWVDSDSAAHADKVIVNGAYCITEA